MPNASQDRTPTGVPLPQHSFPGHSGPRKAAKVRLTKEALRKHDIATGTCQLREFACEPCDNVWWRVVSTCKSVSRCNKCKIRYDALLQEFEFGIGLYTCECGKEFKSKCTAQTKCPCFDCNALVSKPFIHPKFNRAAADRPRSRHKHYCDKCHGMGHCPTFKKVIYPSTPHNSTGSTLSTFLSQPDFNGDDAPYFHYGSLAASTKTIWPNFNGDDAPQFDYGEVANDLASTSLEDSYSDSD